MTERPLGVFAQCNYNEAHVHALEWITACTLRELRRIATHTTGDSKITMGSRHEKAEVLLASPAVTTLLEAYGQGTPIPMPAALHMTLQVSRLTDVSAEKYDVLFWKRLLKSIDDAKALMRSA
ncbi:hypothetical protein PHLGIDRAFT_123442 [Phlebiopsis gigantea 11061_1 CR5-6]|uniref:Uncharacterized protein n=1 Tax=Phlebiopsis gigantea (strain 11061_1 CR5-6) TaxID=745531 RepID=A0A0C3NA43_PHLG1|nr:hypothetical protein PHLGIDRAFT_123442 [Phlebiopsis gigantea 11061_1 CR5-6]